MNDHVSQPATMPHNIEAEQALIGCLLFDNAAFARIEGIVEPDQFYEPFHQKLFGNIVRLIRDGKAAEPITLVDRFKDDKAFEALGGIGYLADMLAQTPPSYAAPD
ncbi:MAG: DnaB-like helicase N-terminal domain-containing protein, partial [Asticcacaulis sp.]